MAREPGSMTFEKWLFLTLKRKNAKKRIANSAK
jgi:hypothetical protein